MSDFLMRNDAPLTDEEWERLDKVVVETAQRILVGRRVIRLSGPMGAGVQSITLNRLAEADSGSWGVSASEPHLLKVVQQDFTIRWQDIETSRQFHFALDIGPAAAAAAACARAEDGMVLQGLVDAAASEIAAADWEEDNGSGFKKVVEATEKVFAAGCYGPYAVVLPPSIYATMYRLMGGSGRLEIEHIEKVASGGVFQAPGLKAPLVIAQGVENLDLVLGLDLTTAYLGPELMDHRFRVMETLALRVKRPQAICVVK